jgi:integrase
MNSITSPELLAQVNPKNTELKNEFLSYLKAINRSDGTIYQYNSDLDIFFCWVLQNAGNKEFPKITKRDIIAYQGWLINENENSPARVRRMKSTISSLSNFCENILSDEEEEYASFRSIVRKIENPPMQAVREKTVWEDEEIEDLLRQLTEKNQHEKACVLALGMYSGRRKAELCRFRVSDFDEDKLVCDGALYKSDPIKTKGRGDGKMIPCYTLAKKFQPYLDRWMAERKAKGIDSEWLFVDPANPTEQLTISTLNSWANTFSRMSGKDFYWHSLRHAFTTNLAKAGIPDGVIQSIVNWESADMVRLYKDIDADEEIGMYFRDGEIKAPERKWLNDL